MESDDEAALRHNAERMQITPANAATLVQPDPSSSQSSLSDLDTDYALGQARPTSRQHGCTSRPGKPRPHPPSSNLKRLPGLNKSSLPVNVLPSAPASPPTPAPSPTPFQRAPSWASAHENEFSFLRDARTHFTSLNAEARQRYLAEILNLCDSQLLSFVQHFVSPRLKKDPFQHLPDELCLRVCNHSSCRGLCGSNTSLRRCCPTSMIPKYWPEPRRSRAGGTSSWPMI